MLLCRPTENTIYAEDFQNRAYSFTVQSIIDAKSTPEPLVVCASAGYSLTTTAADEPQSEQTLPYHEQAPGRWEASGRVTIVAPDESLGDGTIMVRDAQSETVTLPLMASTGRELLAIPPLAISTSSLVFESTRSGTPAFQVVRLTQQTSEPVTLTTDTPDYFQLASDSRPTFASSLTLVPSPTGSYVHVRYQSDRPGSHQGQLVIDQPQQPITVTLSGHSTGLLSGLVLKQPGPTRHWALGVFTLLLTCSLAYIDYANRYSLFPALVTANSRPAHRHSISRKPVSIEPATVRASAPVATSKRNLPKHAAVVNPTDLSTQPTVSPDVRQPADRKVTEPTEYIQAMDNRPPGQAATEPPTQESELERALNKPESPQP
ncbi:hypothetical protein [Spirosoma koreense]